GHGARSGAGRLDLVAAQGHTVRGTQHPARSCLPEVRPRKPREEDRPAAPGNSLHQRVNGNPAGCSSRDGGPVNGPGMNVTAWASRAGSETATPAGTGRTSPRMTSES